MDRSELEEAIVTYLRDKLNVPSEDLARGAELISTGLVDSGNLVRLATHLERIAGISIPDRDIDADHFDTVPMIVDYVTSRTGQ